MTESTNAGGAPKVLVVGVPALGDMLKSSSAHWDVQPVSATVNAMWDAIEAGTLDSSAPIAIFSDGTGSAPDELESTIAAFAPFATTFVVAEPQRAKLIISRAQDLASSVPGGDRNAPIYAVPIQDSRAALDFLRTVLGNKVQWEAAPQPLHSAAPQTPVIAEDTLASSGSYEQAQVYASHIADTANSSIPKSPNARPGQMTIASMSSKGGSGKCLKHDSVVFDPQTGLPETIENLVLRSSSLAVTSFDGEKIVVTGISDKMYSGERQTWQVTTASGRRLSATGNHPLLGRGGWRPLEDFTVGDYIVTPGVMPFPTSPVPLDTNELDMLAVASARKCARDAWSSDDTDGTVSLIEERAALSLHANVDRQFAVASANPLTVMKPRQHAVHVVTKSLTVQHGITHETLPQAAYRLPEEQLSRFLSLHWMTGGRVSVSGEASICYTSQGAAEMMQHLLLRFGIQSTVQGADSPGVKPGWQVAVAAESTTVFAERIPLWGSKGDNLQNHTGERYETQIAWDQIVSITQDEVTRVYDIEVPGTHNFVANDIVVHNSTTAALLAGTIAKSSAAAGRPLKVVLVDLDTRDGQVGSLIGKYMPTSINIRVMPEWNAETVTANLVHDPRLGIDALLAPVRPRNADDVGAEFYRHIIGVLQETHDVVILDCSVNYLDPLLGTAFAMSDEILFVTTLATTSVQGMARSLTELFADPADGGLGIPKQKVGIVANQVIKNVGMGKDKLLRAALGAPLVGQIPSDQDAVLVATNSNRLADLLQHPRLGPAYFRLARNCLPAAELKPITAEQVAVEREQTEQAEKRGLFRRN